MHQSPTLYLIPVTLGDNFPERVLPDYNTSIINELRYFIVENVRSARRFLKQCNQAINIDALTFYELNKHTHAEELTGFLQPLHAGNSIGVISEAGCPAIADPGADVVALAQRQGFRVKPLVGPSSILLALMASGFNGQSFAFHGYLPIDSAARSRKIKQLETMACSENQTQIFIETPYRNNKLAQELVKTCKPQTRLCIAMNISFDDEYIVTKTMKQWKNSLPELHKKPTVFLIYKA